VPAVKKFLKQFLSDSRVVEVPRLIWWFILNLVILPFRSKKALEAYNKIWTDEGSPLMSISRTQQQALQQKLGDDVKVELMMRYGDPSFSSVINKLLKQNYKKLIVLPLYPQNSATTTATTFDHIAEVLKPVRNVPDLNFISDYHGDPGYIHALATSIQERWQQQKRQRFLLMSFHGLPQRNIDKGDPYYDQCTGTAHLLATILGLTKDQWEMSFQSRFGKQEGIKPYTSETLETRAANGLKEIDVICPGFSVDCLETLEEIQMQNKEIFLQHGGEQYYYIPCLNDRDDHISMMANLVKPYLD
ncbi:MAG: ferrochelatase, partial [Candidatus Marinimicrobia bacterium]|nr:ferrochelatase [Candidatus Neomarinimicrobiota bacterium]